MERLPCGERPPLFIVDDLGNAAFYAGNQRIGGAQINAHGRFFRILGMGQRRFAGFVNVQKHHDAALLAWASVAARRRASSAKFAHGALHALPDGKLLADSYHCSRYNTNTGVLTPEMFRAVFAKVQSYLDKDG